MKKTHKRLLGVGGLALVAAITTAAYHIPDAGATSAVGNVDVSVNIVSNNPEIKFDSPLDGAKLTSANLHIVTQYSDADAITYTLSNGSTTVTIPSPALSGSSGTQDFYYDLKGFIPSTAGYGNYTLKTAVTKESTTIEDTVSFSYVPASINGGSIPTDENNNPIMSLNVKPSVVKVEAIVLKPGGEEALRTSVDTNGQTSVSIKLPFSDDQSLESDTYTVKFITYSYNGLGQLVADQTEAGTNLVTQVAYTKKPEPIIPPDDTPTVPIDPSAGDPNNPEIPAPQNTIKDEIVHVVVVDPATGEVVIETELPVNENGTITIPFSDYNLPAGTYGVYATPYNVDPGTGDKTLDPSRTIYYLVDYKGKSAEWQPTVDPETGNLIVPIANDGTVEKARITIEDKNGEKTVVIVDIAPDQTKVIIPLKELGLPAGDYKITVITYSKNPNTGKLAPNQNPKYVRPIEFEYEGKDVLPYQFVDKYNALDTHVWDRNIDAGKSLHLYIPTYDTYRYFDRNEVYLTTLANKDHLFESANRLNDIYFNDANGSLSLDLISGYLAKLPNGKYILGVTLSNGVNPTVEFEITGNLYGCTNNPNPVIEVNVDEGVEKVEAIVYDANGKEVFRIDSLVTSITTNYITLPFNLYCLKDGEYKVAIIPYTRDENGNLVPMITEEEAKKNAIKITYGNPEVPNTGDFFASLNLSQKDFLLTGLIIFGAVTAGGIFILRKKENRR